MPTVLTHFQIEGLHGRNRTIDISIRDRLVLVGENGTGKSTVYKPALLPAHSTVAQDYGL
jgi:predicted ATPase